jgi:hypothetical protein
MIRRYHSAALMGVALPILALADNDQGNYEGDRVTFPLSIKASLLDYSGASTSAICLPSGTELWGVTSYTLNNIAGVEFRTGNRDIKSCDSIPKDIPAKSVVFVATTEITRVPANRFGLTYGVLAVPFKFHLSGAKELTGSASLGSYLGYRFDREGSLGIGVATVAFVGAADIAVPSTIGGATQNVAGFSYGLGVIGTVKGNFQLGGVLGFDRVSSNAGYQYNGKPWIAFELGYSFMQ